MQKAKIRCVSKVAIAGWVVMLAGTALWIYGYFVTGHPSIFDWHAHTPWWIADYLTNIESEVGHGAGLRWLGSDVLAASSIINYGGQGD